MTNTKNADTLTIEGADRRLRAVRKIKNVSANGLQRKIDYYSKLLVRTKDPVKIAATQARIEAYTDAASIVAAA